MRRAWPGRRLGPAALGVAMLAAVAWPGAAGAGFAIAVRDEDEIRFSVTANAVFTLYHELGHALISEFELPVLGREEDAVDHLAVLLMTPDTDAPDDEAVEMLLAAADGWVASWEASRRGDEEIDFWDEHSLDIQRGLRVLCLLYGSDPDGLAELKRDLELDENRAGLCASEFDQVAESWFSLLEEHLAPDDATSPTGGRVSVAWDFGPGAEGAREAGWLREDGVVEAIADDFSTSFRLPRDLTIIVAACDVANAWWNPEAAEVVLCTNLLAEFGRLAASR